MEPGVVNNMKKVIELKNFYFSSDSEEGNLPLTLQWLRPSYNNSPTQPPTHPLHSMKIKLQRFVSC